MEAVDFPTRRQAPTSQNVAEVIDVSVDFNANYGGGKKGLYVRVRYPSQKERPIFFPWPPAAKTDRFLEALEELNLDVDADGWDSLTGYTFRWESKQEMREVYLKEKGERGKVPVKLEYPIEIVKLPDGTTPEPKAEAETEVTEAAEGPAEAPASNGAALSDSAPTEEKDWQALLDDVHLLANGKNWRDLRMTAAEQDSVVRGYSRDLREKFQQGHATTELIEQGRLTQDDDGVFHANL